MLFLLIAVLFFGVLLLLVSKATYHLATPNIERWASEQGYQLQQVKLRQFNTRPFTFIPKAMELFDITVTGEEGEQKYWLLTSSFADRIFQTIAQGSQVKLNWKALPKALIFGADDLYHVE